MHGPLPTYSHRRAIEEFFGAPVTTRLDGPLTVYVVAQEFGDPVEVRCSLGRFEMTHGPTHGAYLPSLQAAYDDLLSAEIHEAVRG